MSSKVVQKRKGKWRPEEKRRFYESLEKHGRNWEEIEKNVPTRDLNSIKRFSLLHFMRLLKEEKPLPLKVRESGKGF